MSTSQHTLSDNLLAFTIILFLVALIYIFSMKPKSSGVSATELYSDLRNKDRACVNAINLSLKNRKSIKIP